MILEREQDITPAATEAMVCTRDPRLREILVALVRHLHAFVREVRLTEDEFRAATDIINQLGRQSNDSHNEAVLLAGSLGVSSLACLVNNGHNVQTGTS